MKFRVLFKTPNTMQYSITQVVDQLSSEGVLKNDDERRHFTMGLAELAEDYIAYGEQAELEFDTDTATVRVKQCRKCLRQSDGIIGQWLKDHPGWEVPAFPLENGTFLKSGNLSLIKTFKFPDFNSAMAFANRVGMYAERNDHHPVMEITWGRVKVSWSTDDAGGITARDFGGASACDAYYQGK